MQNLVSANKGDSESDFQDQTPDTDDSGAHSYPDPPTQPLIELPHNSFKRAPIMGNRGLEQKGRKTKTYPPKESTEKVSYFLQIYATLLLLICHTNFINFIKF